MRLVLAALLLLTGCASSVNSPEPVEPAASLVSTNSVVIEEQPWSYVGADGVEITTGFYRIRTTTSRRAMLQRLPLFLETALREYRTAFGPLPAPRTKMDTYLLSTRDQWVTLTQQIMGDRAEKFLVIGRGGFASGGRGVFWDIGMQGTFVIAAHEGWHQYLQRTFRHRIPVWLDEGVATYMESFRWDPKQQDRPLFNGWSNVERFDHLRAAHAEGDLVPLPELLSQTPQELIQISDELALTYYAQVWALTHFLREGAGGAYKDGLHQLLIDAADGELARHVQSSLGGSSRQTATALSRGPGVFLIYFNADLDEASAQYDAFIDRVVATGSKNKIVAGRSPVTK